MALTSVMGVITNLIIAFFSCGIYMLIFRFCNLSNSFVMCVAIFFSVLFSLNVSLAVFNFLPVPPLDGFNFLDSVTSKDNGFVNFMRKYGTWVLLIIVMVFSNLLSMIISWISMPIVLFWGLIF